MDGCEYRNVHVEFATFSDKVVAVFENPVNGKLVSLEAKDRKGAYKLAKISIDCAISISELCSVPEKNNQSRAYNLNFSVKGEKVVIDIDGLDYVSLKVRVEECDRFPKLQNGTFHE